MVDDLRRALKRRSVFLLMRLDLPAEFEIIGHTIPLDYLSELGVEGEALYSFHSFLSDRFQKEDGSDPWPLKYRVLQGSILPPSYLTST